MTSVEHRRPALGAAKQMNVQVQVSASMMSVPGMKECAVDVKNECDLNVMNECILNDNLPENFKSSDKTKNKDPHSVSKVKSTSETRPQCRVKYRVIKSSGGKFSLSAANGDPEIQPKSEKKQLEKSSTVKANLEYFKSLENSILTTPNFTTSTRNTTPGKRKLAPVVLGEVWSSNQGVNYTKVPPKSTKLCQQRSGQLI